MTAAPGHQEILATVLKICGVAASDLSAERLRAVTLRLSQAHGAAMAWERPGQIEQDIEAARNKLKAAIRAVEKLDGYAKALARTEALKERDAERDRRMAEIGQGDAPQDDKIIAMTKVVEAFPSIPAQEWVDLAAVAKMKELFNALVRPIEAAIPHVQDGRGRKRNRRAYAVAEHAYLLFLDLTGDRPTFWNGDATTPYGRLVEYLFAAYGIKSTLRKPIEAAMHKFSANA